MEKPKYSEETEKAIKMMETIKTIFPLIENTINEYPIALWEDEDYIHVDICKERLKLQLTNSYLKAKDFGEQK